MEFLYDLDDPDAAVSREIDLDADPALRDAVASAAAEADSRDALAAASSQPAAEDALEADAPSERPERLVALPIPEQARSPEEQHQQRRVRVIDRIATVRDAFRFIGHMNIAEDQRKGVARMLLELETTVGVGEIAHVVKDPRAALAAATKLQLDSAERLLGPIEEKLLSLDDQIPDAVFKDRLDNTKQAKKIVARYGRLLASRRMPPGPRRNRFEWLALQLLTRTTERGELVALTPDRARNVLQHLIGGLPRKQRQQELDEALDYVHEAGKRIGELRNADELFDSGLFADLHGYKVSMREHLLSPEFIYLSVLVEVRLHNRLQRWIASQERLHDKNQLKAEGTPRKHMLRRLEMERDDVDGRLGGKTRFLGAGAITDEAPTPPPQKRRAAQPDRPSALQRFLSNLQLDRSMALGVGALLLIVGSALFVGSTLGVVGGTEIRSLTPQELPEVSPLLTGGLVEGSGDAQKLRGWLASKRWTALNPRSRYQAADTMARKLSAKGIQHADVYSGSTLAIVIKSGTLVSAEGARL